MDENKPSTSTVNYLYFGIYFILLLVISSSSIVLKENFIGSKMFYWLYATGQSAIEVIFLVLIGQWIKKKLNCIYYKIFIASTFFLLLFHLADFFTIRLLDQSIWETIDFLFDENPDNFLLLLEATGIPLWMYISSFCFLFFIPFLGLGIYFGLLWFIAKWPLQFSTEKLSLSALCVITVLLLWDFKASHLLHPSSHRAFSKSLPFKNTFFHPKEMTIQLENQLLSTPRESQVHHLLDSIDLKLSQKPNIFLIVTESLREDFITHEIAPHLSNFRDQYISSEKAFSNANGSHLSWFSIFHAQYPFFWKKMNTENWQSGSLPLAIFKKLGYQIRLYTSADLGYYGMEKLLFGQNQHLLSANQKFLHIPPKATYLSDRETMDAVIHDLQDKSLQTGQLFIIFLDSTHFDYSWPKSEGSKFKPYAKEIAYFKAFFSEKTIDRIKNRYRNAIFYIDSLFGKLMEKVSDDSIVVFTGDHGEEFFDHGHLFHASHLSQPQFHVPLYFKMGNQKKKLSLVTQIDIMPSILHYLTNQTFPYLQGESILNPRQSPYAVIARYNAGRTPYEFCIHDGSEQLTLQFFDPKNIFNSKMLKIIGTNRKKPNTSKSSLKNEFQCAFDKLFSYEVK